MISSNKRSSKEQRTRESKKLAANSRLIRAFGTLLSNKFCASILNDVLQLDEYPDRVNCISDPSYVHIKDATHDCISPGCILNIKPRVSAKRHSRSSFLPPLTTSPLNYSHQGGLQWDADAGTTCWKMLVRIYECAN